MDILFTVSACTVVRLRISPPRIKLAASNFARRCIGVQGRESPILGNFAPPGAQNQTNRPRRPRHGCPACMRPRVRTGHAHDWHVWIYTAVLEDGHTCDFVDCVMRTGATDCTLISDVAARSSERVRFSVASIGDDGVRARKLKTKPVIILAPRPAAAPCRRMIQMQIRRTAPEP